VRTPFCKFSWGCEEGARSSIGSAHDRRRSGGRRVGEEAKGAGGTGADEACEIPSLRGSSSLPSEPHGITIRDNEEVFFPVD
jgi:hypothetical protein